ncbi:hypothetical protein [Streptomyces sp. CAU 1734]|uniref:hypothetical protein n=1 Tax=Streptomyces sp. CAU 1734 TaxID=3140360 RepID=UPI003261B41C
MDNAPDSAEVLCVSSERAHAIRDLVHRLVARLSGAEADPESRLLSECRVAIEDLLVDRESLIKANGEAAEELALWIGSV